MFDRRRIASSGAGMALLAVIAALIIGADPAVAKSSKVEPPAQYRGPVGEVQSELGRLEIGDSLSDENAPFPPEQWHRWEFWFEHEKDCLIRTALANREAQAEGAIPAGLFEPCEVAPIRQSTERVTRTIPAIRAALDDRSQDVMLL